ncbi:hypothetical protein [Pontibacter rugosus]|uniref:Lipoprotein n=1 Tax=Pontibacter rugosus TaxID=1745966 RepID=A0ABW3SUN2_9BACT
MIKIRTAIPAIGLLIMYACGVPESMQDFDSNTWKNDRYSCQNQRAALVDDFDKIRKELYGKKEYVIRNLLGKPDSEELLEGNQRLYFYYFEPGAQCENKRQLSESNRVQIRINSVGKISEVGYYRPI